MKTLTIFCCLFISINVMAQHLPHGMVYGNAPSTAGLIPATKLYNFMGKRTRISVSVWGNVNEVTTAKGGWFTVDAGDGKTITAHFKNAGVNLPAALKGHKITMEGVAQKQFGADDKQHYAGGAEMVKGGKTSNTISFEVTGLKVD